MFNKKHKLLLSLSALTLGVSTIALSASCDSSEFQPSKVVLNTDSSGTVGDFYDNNNKKLTKDEIQKIIDKKLKNIVTEHVEKIHTDKVFDSWNAFDFDNNLGYSLKELWPELKFEFRGKELELQERGQLYLVISSEISYPDTDTTIESFNENTTSLDNIKQILSFKIVFRSGTKIISINNTDFTVELIQNKTFKSIAELKNIAIGQEKFKPVNIDWESETFKPLIMKGKIVAVSDGDTATIRLTDIPEKFSEQYSLGNEYKVRIASIDTPEKAIGSGSDSIKSKPFELTFAEWSTKFADENLKNQDVIFWSNGEQDTYGRLIGDFFINKKDEPNGNYQYSYSAEIVRAGLTLPYDINITTFKSIYRSDKTAYKTNIYPIISEAAEEAYLSKNGFYKFVESPYGIQKTIYRNKENSGWELFFRRSVFTNRGDLYSFQPILKFSILDWIKELENNKEN